jgi:hypothetical protein
MARWIKSRLSPTSAVAPSLGQADILGTGIRVDDAGWAGRGEDLREREKDRPRRPITGASQDGFDLVVRKTRGLALDAATPFTGGTRALSNCVSGSTPPHEFPVQYRARLGGREPIDGAGAREAEGSGTDGPVTVDVPGCLGQLRPGGKHGPSCSATTRSGGDSAASTAGLARPAFSCSPPSSTSTMRGRRDASSQRAKPRTPVAATSFRSTSLTFGSLTAPARNQPS